jgi:hypothetical protein
LSETTELQIDQLKPHVEAVLDEIQRAGPDAVRSAHNRIAAELSQEEQTVLGYREGSAADVSADRPNPPQSCSALLVLSAVAFQIYQDKKEDDPEGAIPNLIDSADYNLAAKDQGCV